MEIVELPLALSAEPGSAFGPAAHWTIEQGRALFTSARQPATGFAICDGQDVVAAAVATVSRVHPARLWAHVEVLPQRRGEGLGSYAAGELRRRLPLGAALRCKAEVGSVGEAFARRIGLEAIQGTRTVLVRRDGQDVSASPPLDTVPAAAASDELVDAWRVLYTNGHHWDPVGDLSSTEWRATLGTDTVLTHWTEDGKVRGMAIVGPSGDWTGACVDRTDPQAREIARALVGSALRAHAAIEIELDDWMVEVTAMLAEVPHVVADRAVILADRVTAT